MVADLNANSGCCDTKALSYEGGGVRPISPANRARSPLPVFRENVSSCLHDRVALEPALGATATAAPPAAEMAKTLHGVGNNGVLDMIILPSVVMHMYAEEATKFLQSTGIRPQTSK
jgi:hypothetical protein